MKRIFFILCASMMAATLMAQPAKRRTTTTTTTNTQSGTNKAASDRAAIMFPTSDAMPEDVAWRRDIYRVINLLDNDNNAALYYPILPQGKLCNLFTYVFRLVLTGRVTAYKYTLDGNETFTEKNKIKVKEMLDNYSIYYEEKDGKYIVADVDVPSEEVKRYYIKESTYLDQYTNDTRTKVTAICPVLMRLDDFGDAVEPTPLFWLKYDDISGYLAKLPVMTSNLNNVTNMTADDYFTLNHYDATIYRTNNMQGSILINECKDDTAKLAKEQKRIEKELADFDDHLWNMPQKKDSVDNNVASTKSKKAEKAEAKSEKDDEADTEATEEKSNEKSESTETKSNSRRSNSSSTKKEKTAKTKEPKTSSPTKAARVSVRRQRR